MDTQEKAAVYEAALKATTALTQIERAEPDAAKAVREFIDAAFADPQGFADLRQSRNVSADVREGASETTVYVKCVYGEEDADGSWKSKGAGSISRQVAVQDLAMSEGVTAEEYDNWFSDPIDADDPLLIKAFQETQERLRFAKGNWSFNKRLAIARAIRRQEDDGGDADDPETLLNRQANVLSARAALRIAGEAAPPEFKLNLKHSAAVSPGYVRFYGFVQKSGAVQFLGVDDAEQPAIVEEILAFGERQEKALAETPELNLMAQLAGLADRVSEDDAVAAFKSTKKGCSVRVFVPDQKCGVVGELKIRGRLEGLPLGQYVITGERLRCVQRLSKDFAGLLDASMADVGVVFNAPDGGPVETVRGQVEEAQNAKRKNTKNYDLPDCVDESEDGKAYIVPFDDGKDTHPIIGQAENWSDTPVEFDAALAADLFKAVKGMKLSAVTVEIRPDRFSVIGKGAGDNKPTSYDLALSRKPLDGVQVDIPLHGADVKYVAALLKACDGGEVYFADGGIQLRAARANTLFIVTVPARDGEGYSEGVTVLKEAA